MYRLSLRKVIGLAILLSLILQVALISSRVSAQGTLPPTSTLQPTFAPPSPTPTTESELLLFDTQSVSSLTNSSSSGWSIPLNISNTDSSSSSPSIAVDSNGVVHVVWTKTVNNGMGDIFYKYKDETGWSAPINVSNSSLFYSNDPQVTVDSNGRADIVWDERDNDLFSGNTEVFFSQCNGATCSTPVSFSDAPSWDCGQYLYPHVWASEIPILGIDQGDQLLAEWRAYQYREITMPYSTWSSSGLPASQPTGCVPRGPGIADRSMGGSRLMGGTPGNFGLVFDEPRSDGSQGVLL